MTSDLLEDIQKASVEFTDRHFHNPTRLEYATIHSAMLTGINVHLEQELAKQQEELSQQGKILENLAYMTTQVKELGNRMFPNVSEKN